MQINKNKLISPPKPPNKPFSWRKHSNKPLSSSNPSVTRVFKPEYSQFPLIYGNKFPFPALWAGFGLDPSPLPSPSPPPLRPRHFRIRARARPGSQWGEARREKQPIGVKGWDIRLEGGVAKQQTPPPAGRPRGKAGTAWGAVGGGVLPWARVPVDSGFSTAPKPYGSVNLCPHASKPCVSWGMCPHGPKPSWICVCASPWNEISVDLCVS